MGGGGRSAAVTCTILLLCLAARVSGSSNVTAAEAETPHTLTCFLAASQCPKDAATLGSLLGRQAAAASGNQQNSSGYASLSKVESKYVHRHKKLSPVEWQDVGGFVAVAASLVLAASGGVGGGGLLIPIFMLIMGFRTVTAVALSNVTIVGGTLTNFAFNVGRRHPLRPGPLVDWDLILVMEPSTILGALAGGYINHILPAWLTTISLGLLLFFVTYSLTRRALAAYRKETLQIHRALANSNSPTKKDGRASDSSDEEAQYPLPAPAAPIDIPTPNSPSQDGLLAGVAVTGQQDVPDPLGPETPTSVLQPGGFISPETANQLSEPLLGPGPQQPSGRDSRGFNFFKKRFSRQWTPEVPLGKFLLLVALLAGVAVSDTIRSNLRCPSTGYWLAAVSMAPVTLVVLFFVREYLIRKHHSQHSERVYIHAEGDIAWTAKTTIVYPALCTFAGVAAGLFGVGGGIIKGPLMLSMGVHPQVAAATSATMILFTSAAASTVFISFGAVMWDYAAVLFTLALIFTAIGQLATRSIVRRMHGRSSIIVFAMAATLGCSAAVLGVQGVIAGWEAIRRHEAWQFGTVCTAAPA